MIQPAGQIDRELIAAEKSNLDHIAATLGPKEMSRIELVRKICSLTGHHRTLVVAYNSILLSGLLTQSLAAGKDKALDLLRRISSAGNICISWGTIPFRDKRNPIDLEDVLAGIDWDATG